MSKDRTSPAHWEIQRKEFQRYAHVPLLQFTKYARRFAGDFREIPHAQKGGEPHSAAKPALCNMLNLSTRVALGDLYFMNPRFVVRPPASYNKTMFTPLLARIETMMLNDMARETDFFRQMQLTIIDGLLGPFMVNKVMFDFDLAIDETRAMKARADAQMEDKRFLAMGTKPVRKDTDFDEVHIVQHEQTLAAAERGEVLMDEGSMKYLRKHIQKHRDAVPWSRPAETMRNMSVHIRRVNPRCYMFDPWNEDAKRREWVGEVYLARMEDVKGNKNFSAAAKSALKPATEIHLQDENLTGIYGQHSFATGHDQHVRIFEFVDLVEGRIIKYAEGGTKPLEIAEYALQDVFPSGPFVESSFMVDPLNNFGVCMPYIYEAMQEALSALEGVNVETVMTSIPRTAYNSSILTTEERAKQREALIAGDYPIPMTPDGDINKVVMQLPVAEIPGQNLLIGDKLKRWIEISTGHGPQKMGGGDSSDTATEAAIRSDAANSISSQMSAVLDNHLRRIGIFAQRYHRTFFNQQDAYERVGEDALMPGGWPERWAKRDILMDRGIDVIPGSSRRNNSAIEANQLKEVLGMLLPMVGTLIPPEFAMETIRRMMESVGIFGMDYEGAMDAMVEQAMLAAQGAAGGEAPPGDAAEKQRMSESDEGSLASMSQGIQNYGGGRAGHLSAVPA